MRNLSTTHMLDRLAHRSGEECYEVPVGFKHIVAAMQEHNALLGGESSGGLTIRGHILGRTASSRRRSSWRCWRVPGGRFPSCWTQCPRSRREGSTTLEESVPATPGDAHRGAAADRRRPRAHIGPYAVTRVSHMDGTKLYLENDNWALLRFSGTEPLLRLTAEADSPEKARELIALAAAVRNGVVTSFKFYVSRFAKLRKQATGSSTRGRRSEKHGSKNQQRPLARNDRP